MLALKYYYLAIQKFKAKNIIFTKNYSHIKVSNSEFSQIIQQNDI